MFSFDVSSMTNFDLKFDEECIIFFEQVCLSEKMYIVNTLCFLSDITLT